MTETEICNLALDNLGVTDKIADTADSSKEGKACARWYANTRDLVLRTFPWPFASRIARLALNPDPGNLSPLYAAVYDLPGDFLKARRLVTEGSRNPTYPPPFEIVMDATRSSYLLATDQADAILEYTAQFDTDARIALAPATFVDALAWKLAARLVLPLALDNTMIERAEKMYTATVLEAYASESVGRQADPQPESELITVRG